METLLSIIIPVYNVVATLRRCIDSIVTQDVAGCEILLVDDGSTDGSGQMAEEIAAGKENIHCFHKQNGGLSDARNYGIMRAKGRYITFVDSDDEVAPATYNTLLAIIKEHPNYDILEFPVEHRQGTAESFVFMPGENVFNDALDWLEYRGTEHCWAWNKIFKHKLFNEYVLFPVGEKYEDILITPQIIKEKPVIATTNKGMYIYHYNNSGIMAKDKSDGLTALLKAQMKLVEELHLDTRESRWHRIYMDMLTAQIYSYGKTGKILLPRQRIRIGGYATRRDSLKALLVNILGVKNTCRIIGKLKG